MIGIVLAVDYGYTLQDKPEKIIVLVADFDGPDEQFGLTETLFDELRQLERTDPRIRVVSADTVIPPRDGKRLARELGQRASASLVIWGWYRHTDARVSLTVSYETFYNDACWLDLTRTTTFIGDAQDLSCFTLQLETSSQARTVTNLTAAVLYYSRGDYARARTHFDAALSTGADAEFLGDSVRARVFHRYAFATWQAGDPNGAMALYDSSLSLNPDNSDAIAGRGEIRFRLGDHSGGLEDFDSAVALAPDDAIVYQQRGDLRARDGQLRAARQDFLASIRLEPRNGWTHYYLADVLAREGRYEDAIAAYSTALTEDDTISSACRACVLDGRGRARMALFDRGGDERQLDFAISDFTAAIRTDPARVAARYHRGVAFARRRSLRPAIRDFTSTLTLDPRHPQAYVQRARIRLYFQDRTEIAIHDLNAAIELDSTNALAFLMRGEARTKLGMSRLAAADFSRATALAVDADTRQRAQVGMKSLTNQPRRDRE